MNTNITIAAIVAATTGVNAVTIRHEVAELAQVFQGADSAPTEADIFGDVFAETDLDSLFTDLDFNEDEPEAGMFAQAQTEWQNWHVIPGMCKSGTGNHHYDYWEVLGVTNGWGGGGHISTSKCQQDCAATPGCVGIQYNLHIHPTRCGLRVEEGFPVRRPRYEFVWNAGTGSGPVSGTWPAGHWQCAVNPTEYNPQNWQQIPGMCTDSQGNHYDHWETNGIRHGWGGGGHISLDQCAADCLATTGCVGINASASRGRCLLRVEDGAQVTRPLYEGPQVGYTGVGPVAGASPQGGWTCYANPRMQPSYNCDHSVNFMHPPRYSQISLTDGCHTGNCAGNPVYGGANNNEAAIAYCETQCSERDANGQACEGFFFQKHNNGHEICGFYASGMDQGHPVRHGHQAGAICKRA